MKLPYQFIRESCGNSPEEAWARLVDSERADIEDGIEVKFPIVSKANASLIEADYISNKSGVTIVYNTGGPPHHEVVVNRDTVCWVKTPRESAYTFIGWITE